jgi:CDP-diacylglycerol---serine O-phosphatidyltransferase
LKLLSYIPNSLTSLNLLSGMFGIYYVFNGDIFMGAYFVFAAAFFDFLDGFAARLLHVSGEMGKQLDSLADMVTFGVLPSLIMMRMIAASSDSHWIYFLAFAIAVFAALRLAKFNIDTRQSDRFIGVPTPAVALFVSTLPFFFIHFPKISTTIQQPIPLVILSFLLCYLMVAELPLIALKFKNFSFASNLFRYAVIAIGLGSILLLGIAGIPLVIIGYILLSILEVLVTKNG